MAITFWGNNVQLSQSLSLSLSFSLSFSLFSHLQVRSWSHSPSCCAGSILHVHLLRETIRRQVWNRRFVWMSCGRACGWVRVQSLSLLSCNQFSLFAHTLLLFSLSFVFLSLSLSPSPPSFLAHPTHPQRPFGTSAGCSMNRTWRRMRTITMCGLTTFAWRSPSQTITPTLAKSSNAPSPTALLWTRRNTGVGWDWRLREREREKRKREGRKDREREREKEGILRVWNLLKDSLIFPVSDVDTFIFGSTMRCLRNWMWKTLHERER